MLARLRAQFAAGSALNKAMQPLLREWSIRNAPRALDDGRLLDQYRIDWFREMNRALNDRLDGDAFAARIEANVSRMRALATELLANAREMHPDIHDHGLSGLLEGAGAPADLLVPAWYAQHEALSAA
jgi:hypothetical protein